jgi:hypothetical protein
MTVFTYVVNFTDPDNFPPLYIRVVIDEVSYDMLPADLNDTIYTDGKYYEYKTKLTSGTHKYYFECFDGYSFIKTTTYLGPEVLPPNHSPILYDGSVKPETGNTTTIFTYTVVYLDFDNEPPAKVEVIIDELAYEMLPQAVMDATYIYSEGVIYQYETKLKEGMHKYRFIAYDIRGAHADGDVNEHSGPIVLPANHPPRILWCYVEPEEMVPDGKTSLRIVAQVVDLDGPRDLLGVFVNLSQLGGNVRQRLFDDGTHGDLTPHDNVYTVEIIVPPSIESGNITLTVLVIDKSNAYEHMEVNFTVIQPMQTAKQDVGGLFWLSKNLVWLTIVILIVTCICGFITILSIKRKEAKLRAEIETIESSGSPLYEVKATRTMMPDLEHELQSYELPRAARAEPPLYERPVTRFATAEKDEWAYELPLLPEGRKQEPPLYERVPLPYKRPSEKLTVERVDAGVKWEPPPPHYIIERRVRNKK